MHTLQLRIKGKWEGADTFSDLDDLKGFLKINYPHLSVKNIKIKEVKKRWSLPWNNH